MKFVARDAAMVLCGVFALGAAQAQDNAALDGIAKYREMLQDGNPAELFEMKGEELWKQKRGPKNASLEQCDLGKGPGVLKGAFTELPRFFKDTGKVMDLETRLIHCMVSLQGFDEAALYKAAPAECHLFSALAQAGFGPQVLMNHDGRFDNFARLLETEGGFSRKPLIPEDAPVAMRSFDDTPIFSDQAVLSRWWQAR